MTTVDLLHPELLTREHLINILQERRVKIDGLTGMTKPALLKIYEQFCMPHVQRKKRGEKNKPIDSPTTETDKNVSDSDRKKYMFNNLAKDMDNVLPLKKGKYLNDFDLDREKLQLNDLDGNKRKVDAVNDINANDGNALKRPKTKITWP